MNISRKTLQSVYDQHMWRSACTPVNHAKFRENKTLAKISEFTVHSISIHCKFGSKPPDLYLWSQLYLLEMIPWPSIVCTQNMGFKLTMPKGQHRKKRMHDSGIRNHLCLQNGKESFYLITCISSSDTVNPRLLHRVLATLSAWG